MAVVVIGAATGVTRLARPVIRALGAVTVRMIVRVMTQMSALQGTAFVRAKCRHGRGAPLQRQKKHEEDDQKLAHAPILQEVSQGWKWGGINPWRELEAQFAP